MATADNLQEAFAGESQANRTYLGFSKKADADGKPQIARLFRAAAAAETVHAHAHLRVMDGVKSTAENLQAAVDGEGFEFQQMYPKFVAEAESESNKAAELSFRNAMAVEQIHHGLYGQALEAEQAGSDLPASKIHRRCLGRRTVTQEVLPPYLSERGPGTGSVPRTPQYWSCILSERISVKSPMKLSGRIGFCRYPSAPIANALRLSNS